MERGIEAAMADPGTAVIVSTVNIWEIAIKQATGKLRIDGRVIDTSSGTASGPWQSRSSTVSVRVRCPSTTRTRSTGC